MTLTMWQCPCCGEKLLASLQDPVNFDKDLNAIVCPDCAHKLKGAEAWLKTKGIKSCVRVSR